MWKNEYILPGTDWTYQREIKKKKPNSCTNNLLLWIKLKGTYHRDNLTEYAVNIFKLTRETNFLQNSIFII